ncbi:rsm7p [Saccharomyces arboricola H-6]|uniref:Small ribosomal subunit protein uS7m n=1 Tax=Saccharomyces arboricola (strain H-6 / AS 2.3317 / CBS 10644) TaxID=1160507 RepID=J8PLX6_SACAR|nr:rsm7p [Saccharomyces arboricola H-6]
MLHSARRYMLCKPRLLWCGSSRCAARFQSSLRAPPANEPMAEDQIDEWLGAINELKAEFSSKEYLPETSLAPPGQSKVDLLQDSQAVSKIRPTAEQLEQWEALKSVPIPSRHNATLEHITNMIMRHGKKEKARSILSKALYLVYCQTRQDPIQALEKSLDELAPLMLTKTFNTGVAKASVIPVPLNKRQRNRIAWNWIVQSADQRVSSDFAVRLGEELIAITKGTSSAFDKRDQIHKTAIAHRAYIQLK